MFRRLVLPAAVFLAVPLLGAEPRHYEVGVAIVDITPAFPIRLRGYSSRKVESEGISEQLFANALAIASDGDAPALLITFDNCIVPGPLADELAQRRKEKTGLPRERLSVSATHTHNGPILSGMSETLYVHPLPEDQAGRIDRYTSQLVDKLEAIALEALAKRKPATLAWKKTRATFAVNRRNAAGPVDHELPVLIARSPDGPVRAIWTTYACHCTTLDHNRVSGDWAGYARKYLQEAFPGAIALVSAGCGGDQNPRLRRGVDVKTQDELASRHGREIATAVEKVVSGDGLRNLGGDLSIRFHWIDLPLAKLPTRAEWEARAKPGDRAGTAGYHARVQLERLDRGEKLKTAVPYPVQTWSIGDELALVFLGGEVVVDYSLRLGRELDGDRLWISAYSNDVSCYIPSERVLKEGGYEGGGAMIFHDWPAPFAGGIEQRIVDEVRRQLPGDFDVAGNSGREKNGILRDKTRLLRRCPKHFAVFKGVDPARGEVELHVEGEVEPRRWKVDADAEVKIHGFWGRLEDLRAGDRVWVWIRLDRHNKPVSLFMIADEISEQVIHRLPYLVRSVSGEERRIVIEREGDPARTLTLDEKIDAGSLSVGRAVHVQTAGETARLVLGAEELRRRRDRQRGRLRQLWRSEGLPATVGSLHGFAGEARLVIDHEGMRWARHLKAGDGVEIAIAEPIRGVVLEVRPWIERTRVRLAVRPAELSGLAPGQRVSVRVPEPPVEIQHSKLPTDLARARRGAARVDWFLANTYCSCSVAGDGCTGMFYTLAGCNPKTCGMPAKIRKRVEKLIDDGLADREILDRLEEERGPAMFEQHLLR